MFCLSLKFQNILYNKIQGSNDDDCENCVFWGVAPCNVVEVYYCQRIILPALSGLQKKKYSSYFVWIKSLGRMGMELLNVCDVMWCDVCVCVCVCVYIQGDSRLVDITAGGDFLDLCNQKSSYKHVSDFGRLRSYDRLKLGVKGNDYWQ